MSAPVASAHAVQDFSPDLTRRLVAPLVGWIGPRLQARDQRMRASQFAASSPGAGHIVMLGDSITERGLWDEWFAGLPVLNRGISGETAPDVMRRLDSAIHDPAGVFLLIGTNDLTAGASLRAMRDNLRLLLAGIDDRAPGTPVVVQGVMPRTARFRDDIRLLDDEYRAVVDVHPAHVTHLDLWPALADADGVLADSFTADGIHLNGAGYAAWVRVLRPHVERLVEAHRIG